MSRTVLLRSFESSSKSWLLANSGKAGIVSLDPASTLFGAPCRIVHGIGDNLSSWRFVGALTPKLNPIRYISAVSSMVTAIDGEAVFEVALVGSDALAVEITRAVVQIVGAQKTFIDERLKDSLFGSFGEIVQLEKVDDAKVRRSIRKAQWFKLRQGSSIHRVSLSKIQFTGSRLGSGTVLESEIVRSIGLPSHSRIEVAGTTLLLVSNIDPSDEMISRALDLTDCTRAQVVGPNRYSNLVCCLYDAFGLELGLGFIIRLSLEDDAIEISSKAAAPAPIASIQLGNLYVDSKGVETGETKLFEI